MSSYDSGYSPFSSFSVKVDLAYRLGLLRPSVRKSYHLLRKVRNGFAHATGIKGFENQCTQSRIQELIKLNLNLLETITDVVNKEASNNEKLPVGDVNDLGKGLGWRGTLQLVIASLASGLSEAVTEVRPIKALPDIA